MTTWKLTKFQFGLLAGAGCGLVLAPPLVIGAVYFAFLASQSVYDGGSIDLAREWRDELSTYSSPQEATKSNDAIVQFTFDSGEWVIGREKTSHGLHVGGGTVVLRDSHGEVHAFHNGHVCGNGFLRYEIFEQSSDLADVYAAMTEHGFDEYDLDSTTE
ncbi:MAG: hypothetical protein R3C18_10370 [Planctomycetaceae bacterium]